MTTTQGEDSHAVAVTSDRPPEAALPAEVMARLAALPLLAGTEWHAEPLSGGLTNINARLTTPRGRYVARLSSENGSLLAIDREVEVFASRAAAATGVAPPVVAHDRAAAVLVIEWVEGRTFTEDDVRDSAQLPRIAAALRRLHGGAPLPVTFDMFDIQRRYLALVRERGFRLPDRYLEFAPVVLEIETALAVRPQHLVPCHNDLLAANLIDDGERVWIIDYEYAGNNDPYFELGNLWSESNLAPSQLDELVAHYRGRPSASLVARARLWGLMSKYGWTLWASIQDGVSDLDFDFWSWGMEKYHRAVQEFDGPDLSRWLELVQDDD
jgi:thiamine kinase-like enzyme